MGRVFTLLLLFLTLCWNVLGQQQKTKVFLLGTYHMAGSSDKSKVDVNKDNILNSKRQKELENILVLLEKFHPTKIFVENTSERQTIWDQIYVDWKKGVAPKEESREQNEIFQIGIKLARRLNLQRGVICVDWQHKNVDTPLIPERKYSEYQENMTDYYKSVNIDGNNLFSPEAKAVIKEFQDFYAATPNMTLKEIFTKLNSETFQNKYYYINITAILDSDLKGWESFKSQDNMLRNVNIYGNIIRNISDTDERVLILYGSGHTPVLRKMFEVNPRTEVVSFRSVIN